MPLILRLIAWVIVCYRRWLSGRGPLRRVRCSFAAEESCSAFGLRATREAADARTAVGRIVRRLRRCGDACLLADRTTLSWPERHDLPPRAIVEAMRRDGERPPAIARMLAARRAVALWRQDRAALVALAEVGAALSAPRVCSYPAVAARSRRRIAIRVALAVAAVAGILVQPWLGVPAALACLGAAVVAAQTSAARDARFALHQRWGRRRLPRIGITPARA